MLRSAAGKLAVVAAITMVLCLPTRARATCKCGAASCLTKNPGDSCGTGLVCEYIKDPSTGDPKICNGKTLGDDLCACTNSNSKLEVPEIVGFPALDLSTTPTETKNLKVKNGGGVPLDVSIQLTAGKPDFFGKTITSMTIPPFGTFNWPSEFSPETKGDYTGNAHITSNAAVGSPNADVPITGSASGHLKFGFNPTRIPITDLGGSAEAAANKFNLGLVYSFDTSSTSTKLMYSNSTDNGVSWSTPTKLYKNGDELGSPLIGRALTGKGFQAIYTDGSTSPFSVWTFGFTPGKLTSITPTMVTSGLATSFDVGGGKYWLGVDTLSPTFSAQFWGSTNGTSWTQYPVPVNTSDITSDANIVYGWHGAWAVWTDSGAGITTRYASYYDGTTWGTPLALHSFPGGASVSYFSPNTFFCDGTLLDFGTWSSDFPTVPFTSFVDYLTEGSSTPVDQQIGGNGFEGVFGRLYNHSFLAGVGIDTAHNNTLNFFHGELGGTFTLTPTTWTKVAESRVFGVGDDLRYNAFATVVRKSDPGPLSLSLWNIF